MSKLSRLLLLFVVIAMLAGCLAACEQPECEEHVDADADHICDNCDAEIEEPHEHSFVNGKCECGAEDPNYSPTPEFVDYASQVKFNPNSGRKYAEVTVKSYIDGDTTHFFIDDPEVEYGYLKARYLGINTPESTGVIEPWGKKASNYTKGQLMQAVSIIIESDTENWNIDSTGERYLVWIWYKTSENGEYRNLNLEILQQGLAFGSNASDNAYSEYTMGALNQAKALKLHVFSKEKDPNFYYGGATELSLKEIKANCELYEGKLVKFEAVVAKRSGATVYVEEYDAETDMYFGMQVFCGYNYPTMGDFKTGNRVVIVGTLSYYETGGTYQVSNLQYDALDSEWEGGCRVLGSGYPSSYNEVDVDTIMNGTIILDVIKEVEGENGEMVEIKEQQTFDYGELAHYSTVTVKNLTVQSVYKTTSDTDSNGALTITCKDENGITIKIRTAAKLTWSDKSDVVESDFPKGTVISVKGIIDSFNGEYQIKVFNINDVTFE